MTTLAPDQHARFPVDDFVAQFPRRCRELEFTFSMKGDSSSATLSSVRKAWRTAIHEAAHAVIAHHEGCWFRDVVLERTERSNGMLRDVEFRPGDDEQVRVMLAGIVAHRLRFRIWHSTVFEVARDDIELAVTFYREHPGANLEASVKWNVEETQHRVVLHWGEIERVAQELVTMRMVTSDRIARIIETATGTARSSARPPGRSSPRSWQRLTDHIVARASTASSGTDDLWDMRA